MTKNPFDDIQTGRVNPFGDDEDPTTFEDSILRIEHAARTIRRLKNQIGAEGITASANREMIDELSKALNATASALKDLSKR